MSDFLKYKLLFNGFTNINDINKMSELLNLTNEEKTILFNYFNTLNLPKSIPYDEFINLINELLKLKYREDVLEYLYKISYKTTDKIQINTIIKIANSKESKPNYLSLNDIKLKNKNKILKKKCPHCSHENIINEYDDYIICGYNNLHDGYDWEGCGKDWCFKCGKKLCKKWNEDDLFIEKNRFHNNECCLIHSKKNELNYYNDYCHCIEYYVNRL